MTEVEEWLYLGVMAGKGHEGPSGNAGNIPQLDLDSCYISMYVRKCIRLYS